MECADICLKGVLEPGERKMNYIVLKKEFKEQIKGCLDRFSKTEENKEIYCIAFDCDSDSGSICLRYANKKSLEERRKDWEKYSYMYKPHGLQGLFGYKYSTGDFKFIEHDFTGNVKWFLDSYYYYRVGDYYGKDQPIKNMLWEQKYSEDELKNVMLGIWETMIIETIHELKSEISMIDTTDDFLMYMCDHDISYEDLDMWVRKTNEGSLVDELKSKMYGIGELLD